MKTRSEVIIRSKPVFYAVIFQSMKETALKMGYMLTIHGSMHSDLDLIAVPWEQDCENEHDFVRAINECLDDTIWKDRCFETAKKQPHGRTTYTLSIMGDWYVDLSVMQQIKAE